MTPAIALPRGCGTRVRGGIYFECGLDPNGAPIEEFLIDCPSLVPPGLGITPRGVSMIEIGGVSHVVDWVGSEYYPNVADFIEECLLPGERIATADGLVAIEDVQVGDKVLTHRGRFCRVAGTTQRSYTGEVISLATAYYNQPLRLTPEHPVYRAKVLRGRKRFAQEGQYGTRVLDRSFVPARDIEVGDYICYPIRREERDVQTVTMTYVKQYQDVYANAVRTTAMAEQATTLRSPAATGFRRHHHRLLQCLSHQEYWSYAEIKAAAGHVYRFESGLAGALTRLVEKGLMRRLDRAVYQISAEGKRAAATAYCAYRDLAAALGVSTRTAHRLINPPNKRHTLSRTVPVDTNLLRLVGYYLAAGSVSAPKQKGKKGCLYLSEFSFGKQEKERRYAQDVCVAAQALGFHARMSTKDGCHHVVINSRHLAQFLVQLFSKGAAHKTIPAWVLGLSSAKLAPLVTAYLGGDGYHRRHGVSATTVSLQLAYALAQAANKIGYRTSIRRCAPVRPQSTKTAHDCYTVTLYRGTGTEVFADADYLYLPVTGKVRLQYAGPVYNLAVDEDESYCTTYHSVHNCSRLGLSRRLPSTLDFSRLTPASRILLIHARARVENASLYGPFPCPKTLHEPGSDACIGAWWEDVDGGTAVPGSTNPRAVTRTMPSFAYRARRRPDGLTLRYVPGFFASFPASRLAVVKGGDGRALVAALKARLPVTEVDA